MKTKRFLLLLLLLLLLPVALFFTLKITGRGSGAPLLREKGTTTVLLVGLDPIRVNTDVMMLASLNYDESTLSILQIPRDTYLRAGTAQNKINQVFSKARGEKGSVEAAMEKLSDELSSSLGVSVDYWAALDMQAFSAVVDQLGGVTVDVPCRMRYQEPTSGKYVEIPEGEQTLNGAAAAHFIRYRIGYTEGDLGRVDAQKSLLFAVFEKAKKSLDFSSAVSLIGAVYPYLTTNLDTGKQASLAYSFYQKREDFTIRLMTLPGEAARAEEGHGIWYFVANAKASQEMLSSYFPFSGTFDPERRMTNESKIQFSNIYNDKTHRFTVYTEDMKDALKIKLKNRG